jgi:hypothetical protein
VPQTKFLEFRQLFGACRHFNRPANGELEKVTRNLLDNYERINQSLAIPGSMAFAGIWVEHEWWHATVEVKSSIGLAESISPEELQQRISSRFAERKKVKLLGTDQARLQELAHTLVTGAEEPELNDSGLLWRGLESIIIGAITAAYTAFEVAAGDAWKACLDARPRLGFVALDVEPEMDDDENEVARKQRTSISIPTWLLRKPNFDVNANMGLILSSMKKWNFAVRWETRDAYVKIFPKGKDEIDAIFKNESLKWLAAFRNAAVHNACRADDEFVKLTRQHPTLSAVTIGEPIPVDGQILGPLAVAGGVIRVVRPSGGHFS